MKKMILIMIAITIPVLVFVIGCEDGTVYVTNSTQPITPTGFTSITGDGLVELMWYPVEMNNLDGYYIYWAPGSSDPTNPDNYQYMAAVDGSQESYIDTNVTNGTTYYYTIASVNTAGEISDLSNYVMDTPRPEGHNVRIYDINESLYYDLSGYDLYYQEHVPYDDEDYCDIYAVYSTTYSCFFLTVRHDDYYIQDYGYVDDFTDVGYAPPSGWSSFLDVEVILGHMYMLKFNHFDEWHYAKVWVTAINETSGNRSITFSWAYQTDPDNRELVIGAEKFKPKSENNNLN